MARGDDENKKIDCKWNQMALNVTEFQGHA